MFHNPTNQARFTIKKQLGQGSFSTLYSVFDSQRKEVVALKIEKPDKAKKILKFEYQALMDLQSVHQVCPTYEFVEDKKGNFISMKLLGKNLSALKRKKGNKFSLSFAVNLLQQMLTAIQTVHDKGYIHRDVKPSNFAVGKGKYRNLVYIVDFGLSKLHLAKNGLPFEQRKSADFRGTIAYASLNAHNKIDLSRRDDLMSWYIVVLDFLNEELEWRCSKSLKMDEVRNIKAKCFGDPGMYLWKTTTIDMMELRYIFFHISKLRYDERPDYLFIHHMMNVLLQKEELKEQPSIETHLSIEIKQRLPSVIIIEDSSEEHKEDGAKKNDKLIQMPEFSCQPLLPDKNMVPQYPNDDDCYECSPPSCFNGGFQIEPKNPAEQKKDPPLYCLYNKLACWQLQPCREAKRKAERLIFKTVIDQDYYDRIYGKSNGNIAF